MSLKTAIISDINEFNSNTFEVVHYTTKNAKTDPLIAVLDTSNQIVDTSNHKYIVVDKKGYNLLLQFNLHSLRTIVTATAFKSLLRSIYDKKYGVAETERSKEIDLILNDVKTPLIGKITYEDITDYVATFYGTYMQQIISSYIARIKPIALTGVYLKPRFKVIYVPRDIQQKLNDLTTYFDEIKEDLHYNEKTGYYSMTLRDGELDVVCRHEYLQHSGASHQEISLECYEKGRCKYCGEPMVPFVEETSSVLPTRVFSAIYTFMECIKSPFNETVLTGLLTKFIIQKSSKYEQLVSEDNLVAFTYLFLYKCYLTSSDEIDYTKTKINAFIDEVKNQAAILGISKSKVDEAINNLFPKDLNIKSIFKDSAYKEVSFDDAFMKTILFDDPYMKNIQKLYEENKMGEFNKEVLKAYLKIWCYTPPKQDGKTNSEFALKMPSVENKEENILSFFRKMWKQYCPVNGTHVMEKGTCKYCGISEDGKNVEKVYAKYSSVIGSTYVHKDDNKNDFTAAKNKKIDLSGYKDDDLLHVYITGLSQYIENIISKKIKEEPEKLYNFIGAALKIESSEIKEPAKMLSYICENKYASKSMIQSLLLNSYVPVRKVVHM